jgi:predicted RNA-binding protein YlxR (DUF448 family)
LRSETILARARDEDGGSRRTCVVTGFEAQPEAMLRFALSPDGVVTPDILRKLPGRGVWTRLDRAVVRKAVAKKAFSRGFRTEAKADPELADLVEQLLEEDALRFLSLVNKAGLTVTGAMKVDAAIRARTVVALVSAKDGAADGARKLDRLVRGVYGEQEAQIVRINLFSSRQLDLALGRSNVIHAALNAGPASAAFLAKVARLMEYRAGEAFTAAAETEADEGVAASATAERSDS